MDPLLDGERFTEELGIECDLERKAAYVYSRSGDQLAEICTKIADGHPVEIMQVQNRMVKVVRIQPRLSRPEEEEKAAA